MDILSHTGWPHMIQYGTTRLFTTTGSSICHQSPKMMLADTLLLLSALPWIRLLLAADFLFLKIVGDLSGVETTQLELVAATCRLSMRNATATERHISI